ncbi:MAG TPA: alanine racemase [Jatrophihabitantaceae bacterium]|jgi:alanine racemase|nr:alanine racemase [Jatrophihabitantaceae bacterium]
MPQTEAVIDLAAIRANVALLAERTPADVLAVVKADGYGHGLLPSARAALAGGASWLGVAILSEALELRTAGITAPLLCWLWAPGAPAELQAAVAGRIDLGVSSESELAAVQLAARGAGIPARIHLKIDTGLSRNGAYIDDWPNLVTATAKAVATGEVEAIGIWSHFVWADAPGHATTAKQLVAFQEALEVAARAGVKPQLRHLANSAATLTLPEAHFDLVRPGVAVYGLSPVPERGTFGLTPAMTLRARVALAKRIRGGEGISYGHQYTTSRDTTVALIPLGYADGVPRHATNVGPVSINGHRFAISGRVCMDQFSVDVGDLPVTEGDMAVLFGPGRDGEPTAQDWADVLGTIHYELITRIGPRVHRTYIGGAP